MEAYTWTVSSASGTDDATTIADDMSRTPPQNDPATDPGADEGGDDAWKRMMEVAECPLNFHQKALHVCLEEKGASVQRRLFFFAVSVAVVMLQLACVYAIHESIGAPTCARGTPSCVGASYCSLYDGDGVSRDIGRCQDCQAMTVDMFGVVPFGHANYSTMSKVVYELCFRSSGPLKYNYSAWHEKLGFIGGNRRQGLANWEEAASREVSYFCSSCLTSHGEFRSSVEVDVLGVRKIIGLDWSVVVLITVVLALVTADDVRDATLCIIQAQRHNRVLSLLRSRVHSRNQVHAGDTAEGKEPTGISHGARPTAGVDGPGECLETHQSMLSQLMVWGLEGAQWARTAMLVNYLVTVIPALLSNRGSDGLSICFNLVGLLFMLDLDNQLYSNGLGGEERMKFEANHRTVLSTTELKLLESRRCANLVVVPLLCLAGIFRLSYADVLYRDNILLATGPPEQCHPVGAKIATDMPYIYAFSQTVLEMLSDFWVDFSETRNVRSAVWFMAIQRLSFVSLLPYFLFFIYGVMAAADTTYFPTENGRILAHTFRWI